MASTVRSSPFQGGSVVESRHGNGVLNGAFLDGHARAIPDADWGRAQRDSHGYFYPLAAADL
jgi:prepilin-type processing-associated H-X9-DG protein